ncbi:MAG TPA: DMT family transporter [Gaiellales bacterium]|nr:DMT family transporter [Gaiellales bacterium]
MASAASSIGASLSDHRRGQLAVALAAVAWSTAGLLQRELDVGLATQVAGRALFAAVALLVITAVTQPGSVVSVFAAMGRAGLMVAVCTAVASGSFIVALNHTTVARVLLIQALAPMVAALLGRVIFGELISRRTMATMALALAGVAVMIGDPRGGDVTGDLFACIMTVAFAMAIVLMRHRRDVSMMPATCLSQLLLLVVFLPFAHFGSVPGDDWATLVAIGVVQMGVALALFSVGARLIPAPEAALLTLLEVVLGPLWVWLAISEQPDTATLVGGAILVGAVVIQAMGERPEEQPAPHAV